VTRCPRRFASHFAHLRKGRQAQLKFEGDESAGDKTRGCRNPVNVLEMSIWSRSPLEYARGAQEIIFVLDGQLTVDGSRRMGNTKAIKRVNCSIAMPRFPISFFFFFMRNEERANEQELL